MEWEKFLKPNLHNLEHGNYLVFDPAHQEEIFNWLKREDIDKNQKDAFIEALISFQDECGGFYNYQAYFLAAKYINTFKNSKFADEIINQLLYWSFNFFRSDTNNVDSKLEKEAQQTLKYADANRVGNHLEKLIQNSNDRDIILDISKKLIDLESNNKIAIYTLVETLKSIEDKNIILKNLDFLVKKSIIPEKLVDILIKLLDQIKSGNSVEFEAWVSNTFYYLKKITVDNQKAIEALEKLIERLPIPYQHEDEYLCEEAIKTLGIIGKNSDRAINALTNFLQKNTSDNLDCLAARALWYVAPGNLLAVNTCIRLLENSTNAYVTHDAALFLLKKELNEFTDTKTFLDLAINTLITYIKKNDWIDICVRSICALEDVARNNENALQGLFELLEIVEDVWIRIAIANSLLRIDSQNQPALTVIYQALNTIEDDWRLYNVAKNLLDIVPNNKVALDILRKLLTTSKEQHSRLEIAKRLLKLEPSNQTAIDTLCELIYMPRLHDCIPEHDLALPVLEKIDPTNQLVIKAIEDFCQKTKDQDALIYFIKHLQRLDPNNDIAQKRLDRIIAALVNSIQSYDPDDDCILFNVGIYWRGIMKSTLLAEIVMALKPFLRKQTSKKVDNYSIAYSIIWDCGKKMNYQDFYQAWHAK